MRRSAIKTRYDPEMAARQRAVREAVIARDGGCLLAGLTDHPCMGRLTFHHRRKASAGGIYAVANGATACALHNGWIEDCPTEARRLFPGLVVREGDMEWEQLSARAGRKSCPPCGGTQFAPNGAPCPECQGWRR